jgi:succinyl-CoA synthetase alpha subunit
LAIIIDGNTKVLVQGITGRFGEFVTRNMLDTGTQVVAGVTPERGGTSVWGVPVFNTVKEAIEEHGQMDASVVVVPGPGAKRAALESFDAGIKTVLVEVERVPLHDALEMIAVAKRYGITLLGPGSAGLVSPGRGSLGIFGSPEELARIAWVPGRIGVISRSGGQTSTLAWQVCRVGLGVSTAINLGSEPLLGTCFAELLPRFEADAETDGIVYFGEIGTVMEEEAAEVIHANKYTKPLIAHIAGKGLPAGLRFSHASAIVEGGRGTAESKIAALRGAGAYIADKPEDLGTLLTQVFNRAGGTNG